MNEFKKNPSYLLIYCIKVIVVFSLLIIGVLCFKGLDLHFDLGKLNVFYFIGIFSISGLPSSTLHNCAHQNIKPLWLNNIIAEICGTFMLYGFRSFQLGHLFHHSYPDDPDYDVHPPRGYDFIPFVLAPIEATLNVIERVYYDQFGKNEKTISSISLQKNLFNITLALRLSFIFLLLGPTYFLCLYLPCYFGNIFVFAHINYATHIENESGASEIINLHKGIYFKIANFLTCGGYYHKFHHRKPGLFNPSKVVLKEDGPYITYVPTNKGRENMIPTDKSTVLLEPNY